MWRQNGSKGPILDVYDHDDDDGDDDGDDNSSMFQTLKGNLQGVQLTQSSSVGQQY